MASRWSKRRKLHAEVDHYLDLINQQCIPNVKSDDCISVNAPEVVSHKNLGSSDHESNTRVLVDSASFSKNSCDQQSHSGLDEHIWSACPDVNSLNACDSELELGTYMSTSFLLILIVPLTHIHHQI